MVIEHEEGTVISAVEKLQYIDCLLRESFTMIQTAISIQSKVILGLIEMQQQYFITADTGAFLSDYAACVASCERELKNLEKYSDKIQRYSEAVNEMGSQRIPEEMDLHF